MAKMCKLCKINEVSNDSDFCGECKHPDRISGLCLKCGGRFTMTPKKLQEIIELQPELEHISPQPGMSVTVSHCDICDTTGETPNVKIYN